ncbi:45867_t:CDS:1 [Gigaspora margarita]|uniref:45867_t:CDS:1 n=1 Tax=Gigaspora margarita TaxID=4874 RepID=A0ABN7UFF1_GIGMA|nr:45867_t:CDS:1 [Gigaspora margarita]
MKNLVVPYRLYMHIACELNGKTFVIIVVPNNENSLKLGFQCTCDAIRIDNIESSPSTAINICYQSTFKTKTEYSGLSVIGFDNEIIIQSLINDVVFFPIFIYIEKLTVVITNVGDLNKNRFHGIGAGFVSLFTIHYHHKQHLFILKIENQQCILKIYLELECIKTIIEETPDEIWKKLGIFQKYTRTYLFGLTNSLVHKHINKLRSKLPTCAVSD